MDNKIIRFYNQNRMLFWTIVLTIIAVIVLIHILNNFAETKIQQTEANTNIYNQKTDPNYAIISQKNVNTAASNIINSFIEYCNDGKAENAYVLLSDDCKEVLYPTFEEFSKKYYDKIFNTKKLFKAQAMISNNGWYTYQINFTEDILATGKIPNSSIIDYYTIINNNRRV